MKIVLVYTLALFLAARAFASPEDTASVPDSVFSEYRNMTQEQKTSGIKEARLRLKQIKADLSDGRLDTLAVRGDWAIQEMVKRGVQALNDAGDPDGAYIFDFNYRTQYRGFLTRMVQFKDIGDHKPLIQFLADFYNRIVFVIGIDACKALHLSDIYTFTYAIPVVFRPASFPMDAVTGLRIDEYRRHFAQGRVYYGLVSALVWWSIDVPMMFTPAALLAGIAASAGEYLAANFVLPKLSDVVYHLAGGT
jgi:hypothetical protein